VPEPLIYLDHNATTPLDVHVFERMRPYFLQHYGNAASRHHRTGRDAAAAVEAARVEVAAVIGADPREICWTSGGTESNNLALCGIAASPAYATRRHIITVGTEHPSVLDPCRHLEARGFEVTYLPVDTSGRLQVDLIAETIRDDTLVVSVMHGNNEIGVLHPVGDIGRMCRERGTLFHTDAVQSFGKETIDVEASCIDLMSFSAHKIYGPKGVGGLYVRRRGPRVRCEPLLRGGGHERGLRSGTLNVPGIVGAGAAATRCMEEDPALERTRLAGLRDRLEQGLVDATGAIVNGADAPRLAGTLNISFPGVDAEDLIERLPGLAVSTASACASASRQPSYVLGALGLDDDRIRGSLRLSVGRFTKEPDIEAALRQILAAV
jgi:cysteine desulfurase